MVFFPVWVAIATACSHSWVGVGDFLRSSGAWDIPDVPLGWWQQEWEQHRAHLLILFALWGRLQGIVLSVPSACAAVTSSFYTYLSQKAAGHSTVIERVAVIIWEGTYFISDQITIISLDNFREFWNRLGGESVHGIAVGVQDCLVLNCICILDQSCNPGECLYYVEVRKR